MKELHKVRLGYVDTTWLKSFVKDMRKEARHIKNQPTLEKLKTQFRTIAFIAQSLRITNKRIHTLIDAWEVGLMASLNDNYEYPLVLRQESCEPNVDREDLLYLSVLIDEKIGNFEDRASVYFFTVKLMKMYCVPPCMPPGYVVRDAICFNPGDIADVLPFFTELLISEKQTNLMRLLAMAGVEMNDSLSVADKDALFEKISSMQPHNLLNLYYLILFNTELNVNGAVKDLLIEQDWFITELISDIREMIIEITPEERANGLQFLHREFNWKNEGELIDFMIFVRLSFNLYSLEKEKSHWLKEIEYINDEHDEVNSELNEFLLETLKRD